METPVNAVLVCPCKRSAMFVPANTDWSSSFWRLVAETSLGFAEYLKTGRLLGSRSVCDAGIWLTTVKLVAGNCAPSIGISGRLDCPKADAAARNSRTPQ